MKVTCQCGSVEFDILQTSPLALYHCHCTQCQKQSASAFGTSATFSAEDVFPLSQDLHAKLQLWTRPANEGRTLDCYFCKACGVRIIHRVRSADGEEKLTVSIKGGLISGLDWSQGKHIYTETAVVPIPCGVEKWEGAPGVTDGR